MTFTIEQIMTAHAKVKSGADFPGYIRDIRQLGVVSYETFVDDGHTVYNGKDNYSIQTTAKYSALMINEDYDGEKFPSQLKAHQQGKTDYPTFCKDCSDFGVDKWSVDIERMTCTYYDKKGNEVLLEQIPG